MSEMVEKVAGAIYSAYVGPEPLSDWDRISARDHEMHRKLARAAIEAMKNPPEYVLDAMNPSGRYASIVIVEAWNDAIDAALSPKGE